MKFFFALFVLATAAWGEAPKAIPRGNSKADLAELKAGLTERKGRLEKVLQLRQALYKGIKARTALRASAARQDINLDPLEEYLSQIDGRISALENLTNNAIKKLEKNKADKCEVQMKFGSAKKASYVGTPGATSIYASNHSPANAFKAQTSGTYPWANLANELPATVYFNFTSSFTLAKISFSSRTDNSWEQTPKTFEVYGGFDCKTWYVLKTVSNSGFTGLSQTKSWDIPCGNQDSYSCYGIGASAPMSGSTYVSLQNVKMYKMPEL